VPVSFVLFSRTEQVLVLTVDGRIIVGEFVGNDQVQNVILTHAHERLYSTDADMERVPLGLYLIRGDSVCVIAEFEDPADDAALTSVRIPAPIDTIRQMHFWPTLRLLAPSSAGMRDLLSGLNATSMLLMRVLQNAALVGENESSLYKRRA
jgi:U6 snRNA-associated Sm-like protein LSm8